MLDSIIAKKKIAVAEAKRKIPLHEMRRNLEKAGFAFSKQNGKPWRLIAECKLQSPAKGRLCTNHTVVDLAKIYAANGASMLSVHSDPHFLGDIEDIQRIKKQVNIPILRKDFIIDEYQIYESRKKGADAVLLIARILSPSQLKEYLYTVWSLGMDALVEVHSEADIKAALETPAEFIGINNRNLQNFTTDVQNTLDLLPYLDMSRTIISESGIKESADVDILKARGVKGILVGEGLVKAADIAAKTRELSLFNEAASKVG
jgi:indole-3-glycerol phosphate synthase